MPTAFLSGFTGGWRGPCTFLCIQRPTCPGLYFSDNSIWITTDRTPIVLIPERWRVRVAGEIEARGRF